MASPREIFTTLAAKFKFDEKIVQRFLDHLANLADFRYYIQDEAEVEKAFVEGIDGLANPKLQVARVRHAWAACIAEDKVGEVRKQTEAKKDEDEDAILPADKLDSLKALFWDRYHVNPLPDEWPSDRLLSRLSKSLDKHTLDIQDVWAIKSLLWQKTNPVKKRKLGENLYLAEDADEHNRASASDGPTDLFNLKTYFMALAIVGASPLPVVPTDAERLGSDSTLYVAVPWDLLQRYLRRAEKYWVTCHSPLKLNNLVRLDLEDRGEWTHRFSTRPSCSLGAIIKEVMMEREAVWVSSSGQASSAPAPEPANPPSAAARQAAMDQRANAPPLPKVIDQLRDGTPLCPDFQKVVAPHVVVNVQKVSIVVDTFLKEVEFVDLFNMQVTSALPRTANEKLVSRRVLGSLRLRPPSQYPLFRSHNLDQFGRFQAMMSNLDSTDVPSGTPVFLDMFSGPNCPLSKALLWCGWSVVSPIDIAIDEDLDVTRPAVQNAIIAQLPQVHATCAAMDCSTKTRAREKRPGPLPLGNDSHPRGLPTLEGADLVRVTTDNLASDFALAIQDWMHSCGRAALRENPLNSLHWKDPVETCLAESAEWMDLIYDACVFHGARRKGQHPSQCT